MQDKPTCFIHGKTFPEISGGVPSFMGLPVATSPESLKGHDVVFMGVPWEGVVTWGRYSGCELGPKSIRSASVRYGGYLPEMGFDIFDHLSGTDYGDVGVFPCDTEKTMSLIQAKASEIMAAGAIPITFGGDHSVTVPIIRAVSESISGKLGVIHLDAHMDNIDRFGPHDQARCCPLHRIYEIEKVDPKNVVHMGMRGPRTHPSQVETAKQKGATIMTSFDIKLGGIEAAIERALAIAHDGTDGVYITVCSDVLDVAFNPGGPPDLCGLSSFELARILIGCAREKLRGFDFVEIYPPSDPNNVSSHGAVWMSLYTLAGVVKGRLGIK
jgi:arginase family enzyme